HVQQNASLPLKALLHWDLPPGNLSFSARSRGSPRTSRTTSLVCGPRSTVYSRQSRGSIRNLGKEEVTAAQQEVLFLQNEPSLQKVATVYPNTHTLKIGHPHAARQSFCLPGFFCTSCS
uniref:Uncharacterized protein n=1 Tax=Xiphophorus couchianus TaxID=32473 RepID=A0A3B5L0S8_9TELE